MFSKIKEIFNGNSHFSDIVRGSGITFALKIAGTVIGLYLVLLISNKYGAESLGLYSLSMTTLMLVGIISTLGLTNSILRFSGSLADDSYSAIFSVYKKSLSISIPISTILSTIIFFTSEKLAESVFHNVSMASSLQAISLAIPFFSALLINIPFLRVLKKNTISQLLTNVIRPVIIILILLTINYFLLDSAVITPVYALTTSVMVVTLLSFILVLKQTNKIVIKDIDSITYKQILNVSIPMLVTAIVVFLIDSIDSVMISYYWPMEEVGIYSLAFKIATLIIFVRVSVEVISAPKYSKLYWSGQKEELQKVIRTTSGLIFWVSSILILVIVSFYETYISYFGEEFATGKQAMLILLFGQMVSVVSGSAGLFLNMTGKEIILRNTLLFVIVIDVLLNMLLIPKYSITGAAIATATAISLGNIISVVYIKTKMSIDIIYIPNFKSIRLK